MTCYLIRTLTARLALLVPRWVRRELAWCSIDDDYRALWNFAVLVAFVLTILLLFGGW